MQDPPEKKSSAENGVEWAVCDDGDIFHGSVEGGSDAAWDRIEEEAKSHGMFVFWLRPGQGGRAQVTAANGTPIPWRLVPVDDGLVVAPESSDLLS